jgi:hypothetical protein
MLAARKNDGKKARRSLFMLQEIKLRHTLVSEKKKSKKSTYKGQVF